MDPFVQINRKSREMMYNQATIANERESKKLMQELKKLDSQQQRELKLHKKKWRMKSASSMPCLLPTGRESSMFLSPLISPRAPSSLPVSPVSSPRLTTRRNSELISSSRALQFKNDTFAKQEDMTTLNRVKSEEKLNPRAAELNRSELENAGGNPRIFRRLISGYEAREMSINTSRTKIQGNKSRRRLSADCVQMKAIDEHRDNLDERIKKFHESVEVLKGEKVQDVFEEKNRDDYEPREIHDNVPKLPDITMKSKRSRSLPMLSLANLNCELSSRDGYHDNLQGCRYLRVREPSKSEISKIFSSQNR